MAEEKRRILALVLREAVDPATRRSKVLTMSELMKWEHHVDVKTLGYITVDEEGKLSREMLHARGEYEYDWWLFCENANQRAEQAQADPEDTFHGLSPAEIALHRANGFGNMVYSNPRWETVEEV